MFRTFNVNAFRIYFQDLEVKGDVLDLFFFEHEPFQKTVCHLKYKCYFVNDRESTYKAFFKEAINLGVLIL